MLRIPICGARGTGLRVEGLTARARYPLISLYMPIYIITRNVPESPAIPLEEHTANHHEKPILPFGPFLNQGPYTTHKKNIKALCLST